MTGATAEAVTSTAIRTEYLLNRDGMHFEVVTFLSTGNSRRHGGDAALVDAETGLIATADGVSTLPNGRQTAELCVQQLNHGLRGENVHSAEEFGQRIDAVNRRIFAAKVAKSAKIPLGACVLAGVYLWPDGVGLTSFHVGDGMALLRQGADGAFELLAEPHVVARESKVKPGQMLGRLTAAIGAKPTIRPDISEHRLDDSGALIIATDGLKNPDVITGQAWFAWEDSIDGLAAAFSSLQQDASDDLTIIAGRWRRQN